MATVKRTIMGFDVWVREGTSDETVIDEVLVKAGYRKPSIGFDVQPGEHWLDLGANIGAFALYCRSRDATCECYEPDRDSFNLLCLNVPWFPKVNTAVTAWRRKRLPFYRGRKRSDHARGSVVYGKGQARGFVQNTFMTSLMGVGYDGIKMDIEGSEFGLLDNDMIPQCKKLVLEYHTSRDKSIADLERRLLWLRSRFANVKVRREFEEMIAQGKNCETYYDRLIFCWT